MPTVSFGIRAALVVAKLPRFLFFHSLSFFSYSNTCQLRHEANFKSVDKQRPVAGVTSFFSLWHNIRMAPVLFFLFFPLFLFGVPATGMDPQFQTMLKIGTRCIRFNGTDRINVF